MVTILSLYVKLILPVYMTLQTKEALDQTNYKIEGICKNQMDNVQHSGECLLK